MRKALQSAKMIVNKILEYLFRLSAKHQLPKLTALFVRLTLRELKAIGRPNISKPYTVFMLPRLIFEEDVVASFGGRGKFKVVEPHGYMIKAIASGFLPSYVDSNYYLSHNPALERAKRKYREFLIQMWRELERYIKIDVVVTATFYYWAERELATALEQIGVPFIAMHKENLKSPGRAKFAETLYRERRGSFTGRRILVYNEGERRLQISADVFDASRITVCGMPRLDRLHRWRRENAGKQTGISKRPQVLLFSFNAKTILPRVSRGSGADLQGNVEEIDERLASLTWKNLAAQTHRAVVAVARGTPEIDVVIKCKSREREWVELQRMVGSNRDLPPNLKLVRGGDPLELIISSDVVCGFNSTALLEGLATGKPVIVPRFAEALDHRMQPYIVDLEEAAEYAMSPEELFSRLREVAFARPSPPFELDDATVRVLERWTANADGQAADRVCAAVIAEIGGEPRRISDEIYG